MDDADRTLLNLLSRELAGEPVILSLGPPTPAFSSGSEGGLRVSCFLYDVRELPAGRNLPPAPLRPRASTSLQLRARWCITVAQLPGQVDTEAALLAQHRLLTLVYLALWRNPVLTDDVLAGALLGQAVRPEGRLIPAPEPGDRFWANLGLSPRPSVHYAIDFSLPAA